MMLLTILHLALNVALLVCVGMLVFKREGRWPLYHVMCGLGLVYVASLPAGIAQAAGLIDGLDGNPWWMRLALPFFATPYNMGGWTVKCVFEVSVGPLEWLVGHRSATVLSQWPLWWFLMAVQSSAVATAIGWRLRLGKGLRDRVVVLCVVGVLVNSVMNVRYPWWGG